MTSLQTVYMSRSIVTSRNRYVTSLLRHAIVERHNEHMFAPPCPPTLSHRGVNGIAGELAR